MKAAVIRRYGSVDEYELVDGLPIPRPGPGQLVVRARAASLNPLDTRIRRGELRLLSPGPLPRILGHDVAGEVSEVGAGVRGFGIGDRVFGFVDANPRPSWRGFARGGTLAEYVLTRADAVAPVPDGLGFEEAAAFPLAALTASQALVDRAELRSGQRLLVVGASGGVGTFAVQIGRALGADVVAYASRRAEPLLRELGVSEVVDRNETPLSAVRGPFDVVYDVSATLRYGDVESLLASDGVFVGNVATPRSAFCTATEPIRRDLVHGRRYRHVWVRPDGARLRELGALAATGAIRPVVAEVHALDAIRAAHAALDRGVRGKVVVRIA